MEHILRDVAFQPRRATVRRLALQGIVPGLDLGGARDRPVHQTVVAVLEGLCDLCPENLFALDEPVEAGCVVEVHHPLLALDGFRLLQPEGGSRVKVLHYCFLLRQRQALPEPVLPAGEEFHALFHGLALGVLEENEALHHAVPPGALAELGEHLVRALPVMDQLVPLGAARVELVRQDRQLRDPARRHVSDGVAVHCRGDRPPVRVGVQRGVAREAPRFGRVGRTLGRAGLRGRHAVEPALPEPPEHTVGLRPGLVLFVLVEAGVQERLPLLPIF